MFRRKVPVIEFTCAPEDKGVIAEPFPAKGHLPAWFKKLPPVDARMLGVGSRAQTIKRCMPFLDAMTAGWIIPLAATVRLEIRDGGAAVRYGWDFDRVMVSNHAGRQIDGHPLLPRPPIKLHNYWSIRTPPGWSCLFVPPLNRAHPALEVLAGVVDTDRYHEYVNFPCLATGADGIHRFEKGMPLVQVIPFERAGTYIQAVVRAETEAEGAERAAHSRSLGAGEGWYRTVARADRS
jgi:Family of unknown function (DUF6065)